MKHEIRVDYQNSKELQSLIKKAYYDNGTMGKITSRDNFIKVSEKEDVLFTILKGMNNATIKVINESIDGTMRFMVDENSNEIRLYPISIYCVKENEKYSFY